MTASLTVCLIGTHTCTHKHIHAIKSLTKVLQSWSLCDCTLYRRASSISLCMPQHYGMTLHYPRMKKKTINTASVMETSNNENEIKSQTLDSSPTQAALSYLAEGELIVKAAARYTEFIWRRSPADLSWPVRLCPWLKGSSMLEVFGIDCSKLHHKTPWRGMFSLFHLMKAGEANWHDDWAHWDVKTPASFTNLHPHPTAPVNSSE